jgi:2-iminobutanoate/2-iminopropanoate deaminase
MDDATYPRLRADCVRLFPSACSAAAVSVAARDMQLTNSSHAPAAIGPYSHSVRTGSLLFCSGQLPLVPASMKVEATEIEGQTRQVFANITAVLDASGLTLQHVVKTTVFLKDLGDFAKMNEIYDAAFAGHKPARSTVQVAKLPLDVLVEIEVIAEFPG